MPMKTFLNNLLKISLYGIWIFFIYLLVLITLQYIPIDFEAAFLRTKTDEIQHLHYQIAFFTHVYSSIWVMIAGLFQFSTYIRRHYPMIHKWAGYLYVGFVLVLACPSGLVMGYYGNGGISSQISFVLLSILWFYFTWMAYYRIRQKNIWAHQKFMILSYALTMSAVSLRLFKWIIVSIWETAPMDTYRIVSWLGWLFNLGVGWVVLCYLGKRKEV